MPKSLCGSSFHTWHMSFNQGILSASQSRDRLLSHPAWSQHQGCVLRHRGQQLQSRSCRFGTPVWMLASCADSNRTRSLPWDIHQCPSMSINVPLQWDIENCRKPLNLPVTWFPVDVPFNQSIADNNTLSRVHMALMNICCKTCDSVWWLPKKTRTE